MLLLMPQCINVLPLCQLQVDILVIFLDAIIVVDIKYKHSPPPDPTMIAIPVVSVGNCRPPSLIARGPIGNAWLWRLQAGLDDHLFCDCVVTRFSDASDEGGDRTQAMAKSCDDPLNPNLKSDANKMGHSLLSAGSGTTKQLGGYHFHI